MVGELDYGAARFPDRVLIQDELEAITYRETVRFTHQFSWAMRAAGALKGDHAAILCGNRVLAFLVPLACTRAGLISLGVNALSGASDIEAILRRNDIRWLFFHSSFKDLVESLRGRLPELRASFCLDSEFDGRPALRSWVSTFSTGAVPDDGSPTDLIGMNSSGGTTGTPKGALMTRRALNTMIATYLSVMPHESPPVHLAAVPITHGAAGFARSFLPLGVTTILLSKADPEEIMRSIEKFRVTVLFLPPTVIYMMLSHPRVRQYDYSSLKYFLYSAAPMSADRLREAIEVFGPVMCQGFGQAEAPIICTFLSPTEHVEALRRGRLDRLESCGRATPYTTVAILGDDGHLLPAGQTGEIVVRGDLVMAGYYNAAEATAEVSAHGWHHTGDIGRQDEDGYFYILDRKKDMIISGGFNIFPAEIERAVLSHPAVQDCAVIGVPDPKWGEAVKAVVELRHGATLDALSIMAHVKQALGSLKAPKSVDAWPSLPRSRIGKVLRREIRAHYWEGRHRKI